MEEAAKIPAQKSIVMHRCKAPVGAVASAYDRTGDVQIGRQKARPALGQPSKLFWDYCPRWIRTKNAGTHAMTHGDY